MTGGTRRCMTATVRSDGGIVLNRASPLRALFSVSRSVRRGHAVKESSSSAPGLLQLVRLGADINSNVHGRFEADRLSAPAPTSEYQAALLRVRDPRGVRGVRRHHGAERRCERGGRHDVAFVRDHRNRGRRLGDGDGSQRDRELRVTDRGLRPRSPDPFDRAVTSGRSRSTTIAVRKRCALSLVTLDGNRRRLEVEEVTLCFEASAVSGELS
jgi:hypothetical protein